MHPTVHTRAFYFNSRSATRTGNRYRFDIIDQTNHTHAMRGYSMFLKSISFRHQVYNINETNNTLIYADGGATEFTVTVPPGNYTTAEFAQALEDNLASIFGTVTVDPITNQISITENVATQIFSIEDRPASTLSPLLGFYTTTAVQLTNTGTDPINIHGPESIDVLVDVQLHTFNSTRLGYKLAEIPLNPSATSQDGSLVEWSTDLYNPNYIDGLLPDSFTFALVDNTGSTYTLPGNTEVRLEVWITPHYESPYRVPHYQ